MNVLKQIVAAGALCLIAGATQASSLEPWPDGFCTMAQGAPARAMSLTVAYGIVLGERYQSDQMDQDEFRQSLTSLQNVNRLIVEGESDAACLMLGQLETAYDLPRPDLSQDAPYQLRTEASQ